MKPLSRPETLLAAAVCGALLLALSGPPVAQPGDFDVLSPVWQLTDEAVSGHTLEHLVAAAAAWPLVDALRAIARTRQNASRLPLGAA